MFLQPEFAVLQHAEKIVRVRGRDFHSWARAVGDHFASHLPCDVLDFAFQVADSRFVRVMPDDVQQPFVGEFQMLVRHSGRFKRLLYQEALRDFQFFLLRVARQAQDFHAVLQRLRNRMQHVGGADKHHFRKVVLDVEIVIGERVIDLRIEHFHQRR